MVISPPARAPRIINHLNPYVLKMHFTNKSVTAQVIHSPTATIASSASSQEKALRSSMETTRDVAAAGKIFGERLAERLGLKTTREVAVAAKIGKILAERLHLKDIHAVAVFLEREQKGEGFD